MRRSRALTHDVHRFPSAGHEQGGASAAAREASVCMRPLTRRHTPARAAPSEGVAPGPPWMRRRTRGPGTRRTSRRRQTRGPGTRRTSRRRRTRDPGTRTTAAQDAERHLTAAGVEKKQDGVLRLQTRGDRGRAPRGRPGARVMAAHVRAGNSRAQHHGRTRYARLGESKSSARLHCHKTPTCLARQRERQRDRGIVCLESTA